MRWCGEIKDKGFSDTIKTGVNMSEGGPTCVSRRVARVEARIEDDKKLKKSLDEMAKDLENVTYRAYPDLNLTWL